MADPDGRMRALWIRVRINIWAIFCAIDDFFEIERIGARRKD